MTTTTFASGIASVSDPIAESQERTRVWLALLTMLLLLAIVVIVLIYIYDHGGDASAKLMITGIFTPIVGVAGTVLGFYFGAANK